MSRGVTSLHSYTSGSIILAEIGSVQLEFRYLSYHTKDAKYATAAEKVMEYLGEHRPDDDLFPVFLDPNTGTFTTNHVTLGAYGDSIYEIILKMYLQSRRTEKNTLDLYTWAANILLDVRV